MACLERYRLFVPDGISLPIGLTLTDFSGGLENKIPHTTRFLLFIGADR
jgi:hypothetical protein